MANNDTPVIAPEDLFDSKYTRLSPLEGEDLLWELPEGVITKDDHRLWTVVESDGDADIIAGYHFANREGYLITHETWSDAGESYVWYRQPECDIHMENVFPDGTCQNCGYDAEGFNEDGEDKDGNTRADLA